MPGSLERLQLHVEGPDDEHAIWHLLTLHGLGYASHPVPAKLPEIKQMGDVQSLLKGMELAVELSAGRAIGFVLDADTPLANRWDAVRGRLDAVGVSVPRMPPPEGFIGESETYHCRAGVWLMPDNQHDGKLETFLRALVDEADPLIGLATSSTDTARKLGARFPDADQTKAVIHCWLAWQEEPGLRFGTAITARYFSHESAAASTFVSWFRRLYAL